MDSASPSLNPLAAAPAAPATPAASGAADAPAHSFAATLAHQQAGAPQAGAAVAAQPADDGPTSADPETTSSAAAATRGDAPDEPGGGPTGKPRSRSGGDGSPSDGKTLPPWWLPLVPAIPAAAAAPAAAAQAQPPAKSAPSTEAVSASDAGPVAGAVDPPDAGKAAAGPPTQPVSTTPSAAPAVAAGNPAIDAASSTTPAAPAATPGSRDQVGSCGSATPPSLAATDATPPPALATPAIGRAPSPVIEAGTRQSGLGAPTAASVVTRSTPGRGAAVAGGATRDPGPTAASAATAPVATELRTAVAAVPAGEPKADADSNSVPSAAQLADAASASLAPGVAPPERPAPAATAQVQSPVGNPAWAHELADRVTVLVNQNLTHAQIRLAPAELGPIEVRIALADGQANVSFLTHSHVTSEALQAAAPRLREALGSQGYASVNVDVSQQQFRDRTPQQSRYEPEFAVAVAAPTPRAAVRATNASAARLDAYA